MSKKFLFPLLVCLLSSAVEANDQSSFIDKMVKKHGYDADSLLKVLQNAEKKQSILDAISRPAEKRLNWTAYRKIFLIPKRIEGGVKFYNENKAALDEAYQKFGVAPEIITAIIGVETLYGQRTGGYRVLDALSTLSFHYPPRSKFFTGELENFLLLCREENMDPTQPTGSYAGAMGKPQFIPSSYRHYSYDMDNDGKRDIWNNNVDVIGSVGNYFKRHGWRRDQAVTFQASGVTEKHNELLDAGLKPSLTVAQVLDAGVSIDADINRAMKTNLMTFELDNGEEHWLGLHNFYVITRYNHSHMYAMAVYQLSQEIKKALQQQS